MNTYRFQFCALEFGLNFDKRIQNECRQSSMKIQNAFDYSQVSNKAHRFQQRADQDAHAFRHFFFEKLKHKQIAECNINRFFFSSFTWNPFSFFFTSST